MKIIGPEIYFLTYTPTNYSVRAESGRPNFSGLASRKIPKLYIASIDGQPVYVGVTKRPLGARMRLGWTATGKTGYYGYRWRHSGSEVTLRVWGHEDALDNSHLDIETVESEVVYLIRQAGQWPMFQTEIHFHPSTERHRRVAADVYSAALAAH